MPSETALRLAAFISIFVAMALIELIAPKRRLSYSKTRRWITNIAIGGLDGFLLRLIAMISVPIAAVTAALWAETHEWGVFNSVDWPMACEILLSILILDFAIYLQHVASHKIPLLWAIHKVHHSDVDIDVTTAVRFHPLEIVLSMLYKIGIVMLLGSAAMAVFLFEIILNGCAMFNHANIDLPVWLDRSLRKILVTPDMHRVHHSVADNETDSNYGFNLSIWDHAFRTYIDQPSRGHRNMTIGLSPHQSSAPTGLWWSLLFPFRKTDL